MHSFAFLAPFAVEGFSPSKEAHASPWKTGALAPRDEPKMNGALAPEVPEANF